MYAGRIKHNCSGLIVRQNTIPTYLFLWDAPVMDGRRIPTRFEIIPLDEENRKTIMLINSIRFNQKMKKSFFSQQNMKRIR